MNFKPNKKNILFGIGGLVLGYIFQLFLPSIMGCPEVVGDPCLKNVKNLSLVLILGLGVLGYIIGSLLAKK
ncbi:MAG: hypothetical protein V1777_02510 [Candidatus Micrarchaeota archaeon]